MRRQATTLTTSVRVSVASDAPRSVVPDYDLRPYQRQVLHDLLDVLSERRGARAVAHLPTGAGKTRIACHAAAALLNHRDAEGRLVVWLASSEELCEQAAESLAEAWSHLGNRRVEVHRYWGSVEMDLATLSGGFLVAGLPKLWAANRRQVGVLNGLASNTAGVIFDEAHQAVARTYRFVTEQLIAYKVPLIGLTATPGRSLRVGDEDYDLATFFRERKVDIVPPRNESVLTFLIKREYLADPEFISVSATIDTEIREPVAPLDYSVGDLEAIGYESGWRDQVVDLTRIALERHKRVMVFCPSVQSAEDCARTIVNDGLWAASIVATTSTSQRQATIETFRGDDQRHMALFNYGVLTAGFDAPGTSCVIIARPTTSLVLYSQMVGRAMRGRRSGGNRRCQIYTVVDTSLRGFGSIIEAFGNWEELWRHQAEN